MSVLCKICGKRRARRHCPGVDGEICAQCCGTERENTIECPSTCTYLREARFHEVPPPIASEQLPNQDLRLSEQFVREHEDLVFALALALKRAMEAASAIDFDAREALEAMIRGYRTLASGLIYEAASQNPYTAAIQDKLREAGEEFRTALAEPQTLRDADVLGVLVFLQRLEFQYNNGRKRGRAFGDFLAGYIPETPAPAVAP